MDKKRGFRAKANFFEDWCGLTLEQIEEICDKINNINEQYLIGKDQIKWGIGKKIAGVGENGGQVKDF